MKTKQEQKDEALEAYQAIQAPAWKVYKAITDPAWESYNAIQAPALEAYKAKCDEIDASEVVEKT